MEPMGVQDKIISSEDEIDRKSFKRDILALLKGEKGGHASRWIYHRGDRGAHLPTGSFLWSEFIRAHDNYYVLREDVENIQEAVPKLVDRFGKADTLIDFGSGDAFAVKNKALPIANKLKNLKTYVPIDVSQELLDQAVQVANDEIPNIKTTPIHKDFYRTKPPPTNPLSIPGNRKLGLFLGATISNLSMKIGENFPEEAIVNKLKTVAGHLRSDDESHRNGLVLSYDANPDKRSAQEAYNDVNWQRFVSHLAFDIQNILKPKGSFSPTDWEHRVVTDWDSHVLHHCIVPRKDQNFFIDDEYIVVKKDQPFVVINTFKYPIDRFQNMVEKAGYTADEPIVHKNGRMVIQPLMV